MTKYLPPAMPEADAGTDLAKETERADLRSRVLDMGTANPRSMGIKEWPSRVGMACGPSWSVAYSSSVKSGKTDHKSTHEDWDVVPPDNSPLPGRVQQGVPNILHKKRRPPERGAFFHALDHVHTSDQEDH